MAALLEVTTCHPRTNCMDPPWLQVWGLAIAPELDDFALLALREALRQDSDQLVQQLTTDPPHLSGTNGNGLAVFDPATTPVEAADAVAYALWQAQGLTTVEEVSLAFETLCQGAIDRLRQVCEEEAVSLRLNDFFNFWDCGDRDDVVAALLAAVNEELGRRDILLPLGRRQAGVPPYRLARLQLSPVVRRVLAGVLV